MSNPIDDLHNEHTGILLMLKVLEKASEQLDSGKSFNKKDLGRLIEFLSNFADKCHHGKEEGVFFPVIRKVANGTDLNKLLGEHKSGRDYIRGIKESFEKYKTGNSDAYHIAVNIRGYINLLRTHIKKEEALFTLVDKKLNNRIKDKIEVKFEKLEKEIIGEGTHEKYHSWLESYRNKYLH